MKVEVTFRRGENPRVFDAATKEEIAGEVTAITIRPLGQESIVEMLRFKREGGAMAFAEGEPVIEKTYAELAYLHGDWEARS